MPLLIAVPSNDQQTVCRHFGQARGFVIAQVEADQPRLLTYRPRPTGDQLLQIGGQTLDSHDQLAELLADCDVVLAGGMGTHMMLALMTVGPEVVACAEVAVGDAIDAYLTADKATLKRPACDPHEPAAHSGVGGAGGGGCGCSCNHQH